MRTINGESHESSESWRADHILIGLLAAIMLTAMAYALVYFNYVVL
jgi:hypothetical protein